MEPPDPLQHEVHGRRVGEHEVEVDVKALLNHLRRHDDVPDGTLRTIFPKKFEHPAITSRPFGGQETRVQQGYLFTPEYRLHCLVCFLGLANRIADDDGASTIGKLVV